ncbi:MAG TPA: hypothetical protein VF771_02565 [Longimicrobiaceae bacterium]
MREIAGHLRVEGRSYGRARAAAAALVLLAGPACGGGSASDAASSLASLAAGASFVGELRLRDAVSAVYAKDLLDDMRGEARKAAEPLRKSREPGVASVIDDAERLDSAFAAMRRALDAGDAPKLRQAAAEADELAQSLSEAGGGG